MMTHANGVGVREAKAKFSLHLGMILHDDVAFSTDVLSWRLHVRPNAGFELAAAFMVDHVVLS